VVACTLATHAEATMTESTNQQPPNTDHVDVGNAEVDAWKVQRSVAACLAGPVAALALTGGLVSQREDLGLANVGFLTMLVVLGAALVGGRLAGVLTAVVGALAFNYFHTQPYLSFEVAVRADAISVVLLGLVGLAVGDIGGRLYDRTRQLRDAQDELRDVRRELEARQSKS
jgi:K+-sensing histidine kinase KdpD